MVTSPASEAGGDPLGNPGSWHPVSDGRGMLPAEGHKAEVFANGDRTVLRRRALVGRPILHDRNLATYRAQGPIDRVLLERWEIVRAAGRLWEPVPHEHPALLRLLRRALPG